MSAHELQHVIDALGRTLLHFLWQGVVIALVLEAWLAATKHRPSGERYLARCAGLLLLCAAPAWTFALLWLRGPIGSDPILEAVASSAVAADVTRTAQELGTLPLLVSLWAVGVALFSLRLVGGCAELVRLRRRMVGAPLTSEWQERFDAAAHRFGTRAKALVVDSTVVAVPTVIGYVKPVVLLPARLFTGLTSDQLEALIAHELAHVARHDTLVNLAQSVVESLFFYHPAVWWISRGLRTEREFCCDDRAVVATQDGLSYARALAALEAWRGPQPQLGVSTLGGSLMQRIQRLVGTQPGRTSVASPRHAIATIAALGALGATAFGFASWTAPEAAHDCECNCHGETQTRQPVRWRVLTAEGQEVQDVILESPNGVSGGGTGLESKRYVFDVNAEGHQVLLSRPKSGGGGGGGAQPHVDFSKRVTGRRTAPKPTIEFLGGNTYRYESTVNDADVELHDLAQLERQLAELKVELGDLAKQRGNVQREYVGSNVLRGYEFHEDHEEVHESHEDAPHQHGQDGAEYWIDASIETEDHEGPRIFRVSPGEGGGNYLFDSRSSDEGGRVHGLDVYESKDAKGRIRYGLIAPGSGAGVHTIHGRVDTGEGEGDGRYFTTVIEGEGLEYIDIEDLQEHLAAPHGHSGIHGPHGGASGGPGSGGIILDVHPELDGSRRQVKLKLDVPKGGSLFSESGGNVLYEGADGAFEGTTNNVFFGDSDGDGLPDHRVHLGEVHGDGGGAFEGTTGNVFFGDSSGDGLPDHRVEVGEYYTGHGASGGGGAGMESTTLRRYLRLHDLEGDNIVIEEVSGPVTKGELLFDDHGVRVRQVKPGVLTVETGSANGDEVLLELRTTVDAKTGRVEIAPVIERVSGKAGVSVEKPAKVRGRRSDS